MERTLIFQFLAGGTSTQLSKCITLEGNYIEKEEVDLNRNDSSNSHHFDDELYQEPRYFPWRFKVDTEKEVKEETGKETKNDVICKQALSLLDIAAKVTALSYTCDQLDQQTNHLDGFMYKKIAFWAFPTNLENVKAYIRISTSKWEKKWNRGKLLCNDTNIKDIRQVGFMLSADVKEGNHVTKHTISRVTLTFEKQKITSTRCTSCVNKVWCQHVIATVIYRITHPDKISLYEPITETFSNLTRDQLQKLLQYAVQKDPSALLPVYQCIGDVQDRNSDVNKQEGAPDPSFGIGDEVQKMTQKSIEKLQKQFEKHLRIYVEQFDNLAFRDSAIHQKFLQRVHEMMKLNDVDTAGRILLAFVQAVHRLEVLYNESEEESENLEILQSKLELMCSCYVLTATGAVRSEVIDGVVAINSVSHVIRVSDFRPSEWTSLSSLSLTDCVTFPVEGPVTARNIFKYSQYYQTICVSLVPQTTEALQQLLIGTVSPLNTTYAEPVPLMMLRFEGLVQFGCLKSKLKIHRLGIALLQRLLKITAKYSIVGNISFGEMAKEEESVGPSEPKRRRHSSDIETAADDGLSKQQLLYSLLHVCYYLYSKVNVDSQPHFSVVIHAMLRSLELFRFAQPKPDLNVIAPTYNELFWLHHLVCEIESQFLKFFQSRNLIGQICHEYIIALNSHVITRDNVSIELFATLMDQVKKYGGDKDEVVKMCSNAICSVSGLLRIDSDDYEDDDFEHEVFSKKFCELISFVLESKSKISHCLYDGVFTKILSHFFKIENDELMTLVVNCIDNFDISELMPEHRLLLTRFQIYLLKAFAWQFKEEAFEILLELSKKFEEPCWCQLLVDWPTIMHHFTQGNIAALLNRLADMMNRRTFLPSRLYEHVMKYFEGDFTHEEESFLLYKILKFEYERENALEKISTNYENYDEVILMKIALEHHTVSGFPILFHGDVFSRHTLLMIQQALHKFRSNSEKNERFLSLLEKLYKQITKYKAEESEQVSRGNQYAVLLDEISNTHKDDMQFLMDFFKAMEENPHLLEKAKTKLGMELITRCRDYFLKHMFPFTLGLDYRKKLSEAKIKCILYVHNGAALFDEHVTSVLKDKLLIGQETSDILHLIDTIIPEKSNHD